MPAGSRDGGRTARKIGPESGAQEEEGHTKGDHCARCPWSAGVVALDFVKRYPGSKVSIEGHTDGIGTVPYNQRLSERRAEAVKSWLAGRGVDPGRMQTVGHGKSRPVADNATAAGRFQNRRVELLILSE